MKEITTKSLRKLGIEKVSKFAGSIYVNYLVYMNNGTSGYSIKSLEKLKLSRTKQVVDIFEVYINGVVESINSVAVTTTEKYFKKAYLEWYSE